jgi:secondary thiamine-phosphate synthase enzyme
VLQQVQHRLDVATRGPGFCDLTARVQQWLRLIGANDGLLTLFVRHTSASLTIQENADDNVQRDLLDALDRAAPRTSDYHHHSEGPDDMPAHIRSMLTATSLSIPVAGATMVLGTWQAIYLIEHRDGRRDREVALHYIGDRKP